MTNQRVARQSRLLSPYASALKVAHYPLRSLFGEWNRYKHPTHHVSRLEIPLCAFWVHVVTIGTLRRQSFIGIDCLEDASPALGGNACIGKIGILEDFRKRRPLELCRRAIFLIYRPTAD